MRALPAAFGRSRTSSALAPSLRRRLRLGRPAGRWRSPLACGAFGLDAATRVAHRGVRAACARILRAMRRLVAAVFVLAVAASCAQPSGATSDRPVRILTGAASSLDPAVQGDAGSAAISAQLFESLTAFDTNLELRPALAESWGFDNDGRRITFRLRPGLDLLGWQSAPSLGRRPELVAPDRSGPAVAAGLARAGHRRAPRRTSAARAPTRRPSACAPTTPPTS